MSPRDILSALLTATVWGLTFVAIKFGVGEAPPFLLTALRFAFAAVPAVFFIKPPAAMPALVVLYGLLIGVGQFGLLFVAFGLGMSVGLASVVMQLQAFFTILLAWAFMRERPTRRQTIATIITFAGVGVIGAARLGGVSFWPFAMTLAAAFCWGAGNLVGKLAGRVVTMRTVPADGRTSHRHLGTAAIERADAGEVIVIEQASGGSPASATWGGLLAQAAHLRRIGDLRHPGRTTISGPSHSP